MRVPDQVLAGYFWLPESPEHKVPGTLHIADGGKLELNVLEFVAPGAHLFSNKDAYPRIVGIVEKKGAVTLDECFRIDWNLSQGGVTKERIHAHQAIFGLQYGNDEPVLLEWLQYSV